MFYVKALVQQPDAEIHRGTAGDTRRHLVLHKLMGFFPQENKFDQRYNQLPQGLSIDDSRFNVVEIRTINLLSGAFLNHIGTLVKYKRDVYVPSVPM
jgi:hypothetical protein